MEKMKIESKKNGRSSEFGIDNMSFSYGFGVGGTQTIKAQAKDGGGCCCCCCCCCCGGSADTKQ